jgi:KaiC/GvpD/RAD55 family RecA-like ATPase
MIAVMSEYTLEQLHNMYVEYLNTIKPIETGISLLDRIMKTGIPGGKLSYIVGETRSYHSEFLKSLSESGKCIIIDTEAK